MPLSVVTAIAQLLRVADLQLGGVGVVALVAGHALLAVLADLPLVERIDVAGAAQTRGDVGGHVGFGVVAGNGGVAGQAADAAFLEFARLGVEAGRVTGQALIRAARFHPRLLKGGIDESIAMSALFPVATQAFMAACAIFGVGHRRRVLPKGRGVGGGHGEEPQDRRQ